MKRIMLPAVLSALLFSFLTFGQQIESFDASTKDSLWQTNIESAPSVMTVKNDSTDKVEGAASLLTNVKIGALHEWGSYAQYIYVLPDSATLDWSSSDTLTIWIKVIKAPVYPENMVFRIQIADKPTPDAQLEQYIYENATVLDNVHDWFKLKVPFKEIESDGSYVPDSTGFVIAPSSWGGFTYNDRKLNTDKIVQFQIGIITSGYTPGANIPADSLEVAFDDFERTGNKAIPAIIFNGIAVPNDLSLFNWGGSSFEIAEKAGINPKTNAIKWTQGDAWSGSGWNISPTLNLSGAWVQDSIRFDMKAEAGVDTVRLQFESGADGKVGYKFKPNDDNQWHSYKYALSDFQPMDGTTNFDPSKVNVFQILAEGNAVNGKVIYFDNMWTGNPVFDVIPPDAPQGVAVAKGDYNNLVTWTDVPGETGDVYTIYFSKNPITDIHAAGVDVAGSGIARGSQAYSHVLRAPSNDQSVTYYYAVTSTDQSGNESPASIGTAEITNTAKGYAVISQSTPTFTADGDLSEWSGIKPFRMFPSDGSGTVVVNTKIDGDNDCSANGYVAIDQTYLYVAFDVTDDIVFFDPSLSSWLNDNVDLFIGLYDFHGKTHTSLKRGATPDYHFRFAKDRALIDGISGGDSILVPGDNYYWAEKFPSGYVIEAKIPLAELAKLGKDSLFVPKSGMRIPIDFEVSDNDGDVAAQREGQLDYSKDAEGTSYSNFSVWTYTWINDWVTAVDNNKQSVNSYTLYQNYPNPFNPTTQINYSIEKAGMVTLNVYDVLGRKVASLINEYQTAGSHTLNFNAASLASGIYFYRLEAGNYNSVKKMILMK